MRELPKGWISIDTSIERYVLWVDGKKTELGNRSFLKDAAGARLVAAPYLQHKYKEAYIFLVEDSRRSLRRIKAKD